MNPGPEKDIDFHFRCLRHENVEAVIDVCHHGLRMAVRAGQATTPVTDYRMETRGGQRFTFLQGVVFKGPGFLEQHGLAAKVQFDCPAPYRGAAFRKSELLEEGMLCSLLAVHKDGSLNVIHCKSADRNVIESSPGSSVSQRSPNSSPSASKSRAPTTTANVQLVLAEPEDTEKANQLVEYMLGSVEANFYIVDYSSILLAGFADHLKVLQKMFLTKDYHAFSDIISPTDPEAPVKVAPPKFAQSANFRYTLDCLKSKATKHDGKSITFNPLEATQEAAKTQLLKRIEESTTLDKGQAESLIENLSRELSFTQGPPGTGKSFLGIALCLALLDSLSTAKNPELIVVICQTNHALDDFCKDLLERGVTKLIRLGQNSKAEWMGAHGMNNIRPKNQERVHRGKSNFVRHCVETLSHLGNMWAEALAPGDQMGWCVVETYLVDNERPIWAHFNLLERVHGDQADLKAACQKWPGFIYRYWAAGKDIRNPEACRESLSDVAAELEEMKSSYLDHIKKKMYKRLEDNTQVAIKQSAARIWDLDLEARHKLIREWTSKIDSRDTAQRLAETHRRHHASMQLKFEAYDEGDKMVVRNYKTQVLAMTSSGAARNRRLLSELKPKVLVLEEASELLESHSLVALLRSIELCVSIGDPRQLRPHIGQQILSSEHGPDHELNRSLFERLEDKVPPSRLTVQRRAHPELADIARALDYPFLTDDPTTLDRPMPPAFAKRLCWWTHTHEETKPDAASPLAKSWSNPYEVYAVFELVRLLVQRFGVTMNKITILASYNGQLAALYTALAKACPVQLTKEDRAWMLGAGVLNPDAPAGPTDAVPLAEMLKIATVDNYQGEQNDYIIASLVRSNPDGKIGFMGEANRLNVFMSRARMSLLIIGNSNTFCRDPNWAKVLEVCKAKKAIGQKIPLLGCDNHKNEVHWVHKASEIAKIPVCERACGDLLGCGHECSHACHPPEMHDDGRRQCQETCGKKQGCRHICSKQCAEKCDPCLTEIAPVRLECGHLFTPLCSTDLSTIECTIPVAVAFTCGHIMDMPCSKSAPSKCSETCGLQCGPECLSKCADCIKAGQRPPRPEMCGKKHTKCGHRCKEVVDHDGECPPCIARCEQSCRHGRCELSCSEPCEPCLKVESLDTPNHIISSGQNTICCLMEPLLPSSKMCNNMLSCGTHSCKGFDGEACPETCDICEGWREKPLTTTLPCGHPFATKWLDEILQMQSIYDIQDDRTIHSLNLTTLPSPSKLVCPTCKSSVKDSPRYGPALRIASLPGTIDRIYATFAQKMGSFASRLGQREEKFNKGFHEMASGLKKGPMLDAQTEDTLSAQFEILKSHSLEMTRYATDVVEPAQKAIIDLIKALDSPTLFPVPTLTYALRFHALSFRSIRFRLEYAERAIAHLQTMKDIPGRELDEMYRPIFAEIAERTMKQADSAASGARAIGAWRLEAEILVSYVAFAGVTQRLSDPPGSAIIDSNKLTNAETTARKINTSLKITSLSNNLDDVTRRNEQPDGEAAGPASMATQPMSDAEHLTRMATHSPGTTRLCPHHQHTYSQAAFPSGCPECCDQPRSPVAGGTPPHLRAALRAPPPSSSTTTTNSTPPHLRAAARSPPHLRAAAGARPRSPAAVKGSVTKEDFEAAFRRRRSWGNGK